MTTAIERGTERGTLVVVCGLPGAGKTTLARVMERERAGLRLAPDEWMAMLGMWIWDEAGRDRVERLQWSVGKRLLALGQTVIVEWGTWGRGERDVLREEAREVGARVELVYLTEAPEELFRRIAARGMENPPVRWEQVVGWGERFQAPGAEEGALWDRFEVKR